MPSRLVRNFKKKEGMSHPWEYPFWGMESLLFSRTRYLLKDAASFKADIKKKIVQYFDKDGVLLREEYLDNNRTLISNEYKDGKLAFQTKTSIKSGNKVTQFFDGNGVLTQESYFDENNSLVRKKYDKYGKVTSEKKTTYKELMGTPNEKSNKE